ncbi:MAG TPA: PA domain-containing protein, partial [Candidatus Obscuribacterales bacterium]
MSEAPLNKRNTEVLIPITHQLWLRAALAAVVAMPITCGFTPTSAEAEVQAIVDSNSSRAIADVKALVAFGPRVTGTPAAQKASSYLISEYRKAGYSTKIQTFTYSKFADLGSRLKVGDLWLKGRALSGSPRGNLLAPLVAVPNLGRPEDYATVDVKGAIALVRRGEIRFLDKARHAAAAGAVGIVIVNSQPGEFYGGVLGGDVSIPVFALSGDRGKPLFDRA